MNCENFINARVSPFHDTDRVWKNIGHPSTGLIWSHGPANPVGADCYNISFSQCMYITVLVEIITTKMAIQNNDADENFINLINLYLFIYTL